MKNLNQKLVEMKYNYMRKQNLENAKQEIEEHMQREQQTLIRLKQSLQKEQEDVERLEHASLNRLLSSLSGRSELRLEKEKAEVYRAALDYKLKKKDMEYLQFQHNLLVQELKKYETLDQDYQGLLDVKRKSLPAAILNDIRQMEITRADWQKQLVELKEAILSGKKLRDSFTYILDNLSELVEDTTDAKSLWYPVISQDQIEDVSKEIAKLNDLWKNFEKELSDTQITLPPTFDQDFLIKVSDYFYDLSDKKKVTKKINTSFEQLNATYSSVREILNLLEKREKEIQYCIQDLDLDIPCKIETSI